jgi:hypothetical protein
MGADFIGVAGAAVTAAAKLGRMGLTDILFGRKRLAKPKTDRLFALSTAAVTLDTELGLRPAGVAAVCFKPLSAGEFVRAENELQALLEKVAADSGSRIERRSDELGFDWLIVHDNDLEDLVTTVHLIGSELQDRGFGDRLLAAAFRFSGGKDPVYWIYGYKRGAFWPFIPCGEDKKRDNAEELELKAKLDKELPIEQDLTAWFGLFDAPI